MGELSGPHPIIDTISESRLSSSLSKTRTFNVSRETFPKSFSNDVSVSGYV